MDDERDAVGRQSSARNGASFEIGQRVFFWTGRGSQGYGTIAAVKNERFLIEPDADALKGSDFRAHPPGSKKADSWAPRDYGVMPSQINSPPDPWFQDS